MMTRAHAGRVALGVAIAVDRVVVASRDARGDAWSQSFSVPKGASEHPVAELGEALTDALWTTRAKLGAGRVSVAVALLPPLVHCRVIDMPGLGDEEIQHVLCRDAASYFPVSATPHVVGATKVRHVASRTSAVLAAAAPSALVDAIHDAATSAGCSVAAIVPAAAAWAAATERVWKAPSSTASTLVASLDGHVDVLTVERGELTAARRLRSIPPDHRPVIAVLGANTEVMLLGDALRDPLAESLKASGVRLAPALDAELAASPETLAASFAPYTAAPILMPEPVRGERRRRATRRAVQMVLASAALLIGAGALELWGVRRELATVIAARMELRGRLAGALATRDTVTILAEQLAALQSAEASAPRWSDALALVAAYLPRDAHLLSLRAEGDSLLLEGVAHRAAPVLEAMARVPAAFAVRAQGSIRQEVRDDVGQVERFTMSVRLTGGAP